MYLVGNFKMRKLPVFVLMTLAALANSQLEEYTLNFDSAIYVCPDESSQAFVDTAAVEVKRHNETSAMMTGSIKFLKGIERGTMIELIIEKDVGGSFQMVASHEICDMCKELVNTKSPYSEYLQNFGFPSECPFEPNSYSIKDFVADTKDLPLSSATAGKYQVTMNILQNSEEQCPGDKTFAACLKLDLLVEEV